MTENPDRRITVATVVSLLLHFLLLFWFAWGGLLPKEERADLTSREMEIVDIRKPEREARPEKSRFLGLYDSRVDQEQVSPTENIPASRRRIVEGEGGRDPERPGEGEDAVWEKEGSTPEEQGEDLVSVLPEEFFPDITIGQKTYLNVFRYDNIEYFVRLKKIFKLTWNPHPVVMEYLFTHPINGGSIQATVAFEIDRQGNLKKLFLYRSSGYFAYDEESLRVIEASSPFAAPPEHLLNKDGVLALSVPFTVYF